MFKVLKAEIKKTVSKPGIYILALFLAVVLVLGVLVYKPKEISYTNLPVFNDISAWESEGKFKDAADLKITQASNAVLSYKYTNNEDSNDPNNGKTYYEIMYGADGKGGLMKTYSEHLNTMRVRKNASASVATAAINNFVSTLNEINKIIVASTNQNTLAHTAIATIQNYEDYFASYNSICVSTDSDGVFARPNDSLNLVAKVDKYLNTYKNKYESALSSYVFPTISEELVKTYTVNEKGTRLYTILTRLDEIDKKMKKLVDDGLTKKSMDTYNEYANLYNNTANVFNSLVKYELLSNAYKFVSTSDKIKLKGLENETEYNSNTQLVRYKYLFEKNKTEQDFANPLAVGSTITPKTTAFDYAFFTLKLFSFIIIAYAIMSACGTIGGEIKEGSMRYYAIRPIKRSSIILGKFMSIILMSTIMIVFSSIVALCVGAGVYGWTNLNILTIFNGTTAMVINPIIMLVIFLLSFIIELTIYTAIAMLLANLIKSDLLASTILLLLYLINIILPVFAGGMNSWLAFYPFSHVSLFSLFGSSIVSIDQGNMLNSLLKVNIYANTNLILFIVISVLLIIIPIWLATHLFKNREL